MTSKAELRHQVREEAKKKQRYYVALQQTFDLIASHGLEHGNWQMEALMGELWLDDWRTRQ